MKKIVYALMIAISSAMVFTSCTEEEITPSSANGGGDDIITIRK